MHVTVRRRFSRLWFLALLVLEGFGLVLEGVLLEVGWHSLRWRPILLARGLEPLLLSCLNSILLAWWTGLQHVRETKQG